ncbi:hypothetical protein DDT54_10610 [Brenneria nigrifluens DSM 30175 = ATCC 13028]|nr:hypothetical protein DDT54_10610 [Brenneria nigrifluens DSM 30175 = ATCC 13028]
MQTLNRHHFPGRRHPDRVIQFGEGNFLRAFIDWHLDLLNEHTDLDAGIVVVRPRDADSPSALNGEDGLYTTLVRGLNEQGEAVRESRLIRSVNREINTYRQFDEYLVPKSELAQKKAHWTDFDAGRLIHGMTMDELLARFVDLIVEIADGKAAKNEINDFRELAIFKSGVTL